MGSQQSLPSELLPSQIQYDSGGAIEEVFNTLTHAIAAGLSVAGLVALLILTGNDPSPWKYVGFSIYGTSQILLFLSSALTHGFAAHPRIRRRFAMLDHAFIYVLIAGTYSPACLIAMRGDWGWFTFGVIWGLAIVGIVLKLAFFDKANLVANLLYIPMGWFIVLVFRPVIRAASLEFFIWALIGGAWYTLGFIFFAWKKLPFSHVVWHLFVIGGSLSFFVAFVLYLV
jgi:hemolysin III